MGDRAAAQQYLTAGEQAAQRAGNSTEGLTQAYGNLLAASYVDPTFGHAHYILGNTLADLQKAHAAVATYRRALECENSDANLARIYCNLGWQLHIIGHTHEALEYSQKAVDLDPAIAHAWANLSIVYTALNCTQTAVDCAYKAVELMPEDATMQTMLAFSLMFNREFAEGLRHFEARFRYKLHRYLEFPFTRWRGEAGKTICVVADQGLGDTLSFARFVERASKKAKYLHLMIQPELMQLFDYSFMHLKNINLLPMGAPLPAYDHWTTFVSLPHCLKLSNEEIVNEPHFKADYPAKRSDWKVPDRKFHIGIAWAGSALNEINRHRSIPLQHFLELSRVPGVQLYSLQKDDNRQELYNSHATASIVDLSGYIAGVSDTLGFMDKLDLVISCESAAAHMAALIDKECWVPYSRLGKDFRIGVDGSKAIWTPKHRFFLQDESDSWGPVFEDIVGAVGVKLDKQGGNAS